MTHPFNVVIPVHNESVSLKRTAPALRAALEGFEAHVVYVLNATTDDSHAVIQSFFGDGADVVSLPDPGKPAALRAGDRAARHSITFYLDADVVVGDETFALLLAPLLDGSADLVAPRLVCDLSQSSGTALRVGRVWADQLSRRTNAFMGCTGLSAAGLQARGPWIDIIADDDWARNRIDPSRRKRVDAARVTIDPPRDIKSWLHVRARWIKGSRELKQRGFAKTEGPDGSARPQGAFADLLAYYAVRLLAEPVVLWHQFSGVRWARDESTRVTSNE